MRKEYPIMLGCYEKGDKCIVAGKDDILGHYSMFICRLKHQVDYGAEVEPVCVKVTRYRFKEAHNGK